MDVERENPRKRRKYESGWSSLPKDLFDLIAEKLGPADLIRVSCLCNSWRSISPPYHLWLVLPCHTIITIDDHSEDDDDDDYNATLNPENALGFFRFVSLSHPNRKVHNLQIPEAKGCVILGSSAGWFVTLRANGAIRLLHPFSRATIQLPPLKLARFNGYRGKINKLSIEKVIVGSDSDGKSLILCKDAGKLAFYRPEKDLNWVFFQNSRGVIEDMVGYKGRFYGIKTSRNNCHVCVASGLDDSSPTMEAFLEIPKYRGYVLYYLVESSGNLVLVLRHLNWPKDFGTNGFTVFRIDQGGMVELQDLADQALFLDCNSAFSASAFDFPAIKGNHIYFSNSFLPNSNWIGNCDMEIFNLKEKSFESYDCCVDDHDLIMQAPMVFPTNSCWRGGFGFRMLCSFVGSTFSS